MASAGTKRGAAYTARRFPRAYSKPVVRRGRIPTLASKVRALIAGKTKDTEDVTRSGAHTATTVSCLTSSTDFATAPSATAIIKCDADEALINHVDVQQLYSLACLEDATPVGLKNALMRTIVVWFHKPLAVPNASGTLPAVTEVLVTDALTSMPWSDTQNAGRFTILYDKTQSVGSNTVGLDGAASNARLQGDTTILNTFRVKVNKRQIYFNSASGSNEGGHYDSDEPQGLVRAGLLCMYTLGLNQTTSGTMTVTCTTRLSYTA